MHPTAHVTVTDIEPTSVAAIAAGNLGRHPRAVVREMDATAIDAPDGHYDLAVFANSLHHLPPALAARVFAEGTRAADKLLIIDLPRLGASLHLVQLALALPLAMVVPYRHDAFISSLRAYSPSALRALARYAGPAITVELPRGGAFGPQIVVAARCAVGKTVGSAGFRPAVRPSGAAPMRAHETRKLHRKVMSAKAFSVHNDGSPLRRWGGAGQSNWPKSGRSVKRRAASQVMDAYLRQGD